ncbi:MAG: HAD hydrolase family protein [Verrucomicrobia bacterium]|nr:HAD hydrolase family protein [Verrucomicrobiota bacterium]
MHDPIKLLSTDFDGTLHEESDEPPIPFPAQRMIGRMQARGVIWVINTGRDLPSLLDSLVRARFPNRPDFVVTVEREIHERRDSTYIGWADWNSRCGKAHERIFAQVRSDMPRLANWINRRFEAKVYEDTYSPLCLIAQSSQDADVIHDYLNDYCSNVPNLTVVRNHIYARLSHADYNKGSALAEIARRVGVTPGETAAAGDHLNDLPMLSTTRARWLIAPSNAVEQVKALVRQQNGYVSDQPHGYGLARGLEQIEMSCRCD